ncbi:MAG: hypothetical protein HY287_00710 [Planctomycetes bacterium]|nr:hypothetical protein [Planctomycetota bacterium]MBI3832829.1 hypothetical protein [Planctomycetota bacterium]
MSTYSMTRTRWRLSGAGVLLALSAVSLWPSYASAPVSDPVVAVEEDWELVVNDPNDNVISPQFQTIMSPTPDASGYYAQTLWNYRETPDFQPGGVQLQSYLGESLVRTRSVEHRILSTSAETITWTQALQTDGETLTFSVVNGQSTTWGDFGKDMTISYTAKVQTLNDYDPEYSASNACVTYGSNRVQSLTLKEVRYFGAGGVLLAVDSTPHSASY